MNIDVIEITGFRAVNRRKPSKTFRMFIVEINGKDNGWAIYAEKSVNSKNSPFTLYSLEYFSDKGVSHYIKPKTSILKSPLIKDIKTWNDFRFYLQFIISPLESIANTESFIIRSAKPELDKFHCPITTNSLLKFRPFI